MKSDEIAARSLGYVWAEDQSRCRVAEDGRHDPADKAAAESQPDEDDSPPIYLKLRGSNIDIHMEVANLSQCFGDPRGL